jgi:hypothetical protein
MQELKFFKMLFKVSVSIVVKYLQTNISLIYKFSYAIMLCDQDLCYATRLIEYTAPRVKSRRIDIKRYPVFLVA